MSREEAMKALIESGMELRRDDIELGKKLERERIIKLLEDEELHTHPNNTMANYDKLVWEGIKEQLIALIKGEPNGND